MRFTLQALVACLAADASAARGQLRQGSDQRDDRKLQIEGGGRPHPTPSSVAPLSDEEQSEIVSLSKACAVGEESKCCHELGAEGGGIVKNVFAWTRQCEIDLPSSKIQVMSRNAKVSAVEHNAPVWALQAPLSWGLDRIDQVDLPLDNSATKLDAAGTRVFILDTGVRGSHNDFVGSMGPAGCHVNTSGDGGAPQTDRNGHGTHVGSTACGQAYGVTANCEICSVQVLRADGFGSYASIIAGVNFAIAQCPTGLCVANMSLGGGLSSALNAAVAAAYDNGVVMVVAAGNFNNDACLNSPASETTAITVGSTTRSDTARRDSSFGPCVDVYAPGDDITAAWHTGDTATNTIGGTSMASPHVAGIAASLVGQGKATNPEEVTDWILDNVVAKGIDTRGPGRDQGLVYVFEKSWNYLQISSWRIAKVCETCSASHFSISSENIRTSQIFRDDGTAHRGPRSDFNGWDTSSGTGPANSLGVLFGNIAVQVGDWRIRQIDAAHLSVTNHNGNVARIYRSDGTVHGNVRDFSGYRTPLGAPTCAYLSERYFQVGVWRFGAVDANHFSVTHKAGKTAMIYRKDGTIHGGPRSDFNAWDLPEGEALMGTKDGCASLPSSPYSPPPPSPPPPSSPSCMSGETRVGIMGNKASTAKSKPVRDLDVGDVIGLQSQKEPTPVRDLVVGDIIEGLDGNMDPATCSVEAIGHYGTGPVFGNYTKDHFTFDSSEGVVRPSGIDGEMNIIDKYAVLTSCPVGLDESGVGFTAVDSDFLGYEALAWSDYIVVHEAIVKIVREVGSFVFSPSTYSSINTVKKYTNRLYKTMLKCAQDSQDSKACHDFEKAAADLTDNALTKGAKKKVKSVFGNLGKSTKPGSLAAVVSKDK